MFVPNGSRDVARGSMTASVRAAPVIRPAAQRRATATMTAIISVSSRAAVACGDLCSADAMVGRLLRVVPMFIIGHADRKGRHYNSDCYPGGHAKCRPPSTWMCM